ncbi:MAG TPA: hypothetical protein VME69_11005, partial [Methylocella sp.]|nr:hypothetical protein [Methylocella sp.]
MAEDQKNVVRSFARIAALLSLWIATHPYMGIFHDGRLYTLQALNRLDPTRYSQDLYFSFGSQDSLTEFSHLYGPLLFAFGTTLGHFYASIFGATLWMGALNFLIRPLFHARCEVLTAFVACIVLDASYGGFGIFHYGEGFTSPRIFAEAMVMTSLGLCLRKQLPVSVLGLAGALAIHPIMAATGIAVVGTWVALENSLARLFIIFAALIGVFLALADVQPFTRLLASFDPEWFGIVWKRCGFGFLLRWKVVDYLHVVAVGSTLSVAYALGDAIVRRLIVCIAITSI